MRSIRDCMALLALAFATSCSVFDIFGPDKAGPNIVAVSLNGDQSDVFLTGGDTLTLVAEAIVPCQLTFCPLFDSSTRPERFRFQSEKPFVATIDSHGRVSAIAPGTTRITASIDNLSSALVLRVSPAAASLVTDVDSVTARVGDTIRISVSAVDSDGHPVSGVFVEEMLQPFDTAVVSEPYSGVAIPTPATLPFPVVRSGSATLEFTAQNERPDRRFTARVRVVATP